MRIRMLSTQRGSEDGAAVRTYLAGKEYVLSSTPRGRELAAVFLREKWAEEVTSARPAPPPPHRIELPPEPPAPVEVVADPEPAPKPSRRRGR